MRLIIRSDYASVTQWVAQYLVHRINEFSPTAAKPFVLGLPTGSSPLGVYRELIRLCTEGQVSFAHVITFNMDEYVALDENHPQSYHRFMWDNLFSHIDIKRDHIHILNGMAQDPEEECRSYERQIAEAGA